MIEDLEYLIQLQEIDLRIREQELSQEQFPAAVAELENGISKAKTDLEDIEAKLKKMESEKGSSKNRFQRLMNPWKKPKRLNSIKQTANMMLCMRDRNYKNIITVRKPEGKPGK